MGEHIADDFDVIDLPAVRAFVRRRFRADVEMALAQNTLHGFAGSQSGVRAFPGRGPALAFTGPVSGDALFVRRSRHGGFLGPFTGEVFLGSARAEHEIHMAATLRQRGIPTPDVHGYVKYRVAGIFCRIDVLLSYVDASRDLARFLADEQDDSARRAALDATARLLQQLSVARVRHPDLNARNVLLVAAPGGVTAWVIDVDRTVIDGGSSEAVASANRNRLLHSLKKLVARGSARVSRSEEAILAAVRPPGVLR
jgi:hypothetical protein